MLCVTITIVISGASSAIVSSIDAGRDRVERRTRFVHEQHLRPDRERAGDAQPLLLAARQRHAALVESILHLRTTSPARVSDSSTSASLSETLVRVELEPGEHVVGRSSSRGTGSASGTPCRCACAPASRSTRRRRCRRRRARPDRRSARPGITSCIRLRMRRKVDLPHPDGPMSAVTRRASIASEQRSSTLRLPNHTLHVRRRRASRRGLLSGCSVRRRARGAPSELRCRKAESVSSGSSEPLDGRARCDQTAR